MRLEHAKLLLNLAETGSFNQTAERFYTTAQSISYRVKQLEKELNVQIFYRTNTGVVFTAEGEYVLELARQIQELYQEFTHKIQQERLNNEQTIETPSRIKLLAVSVIPLLEIKKNFTCLYPEVPLIIKEVDNTAVLSSLLKNKCDMALWSVNRQYFEEQIKGFEDELTYEVLEQDRIVVVMSAKLDLARKSGSIITAQDIAEKPKSKLGLLPWERHLPPSTDYGVYEGDNIAMHQHIILNEGGITFMSEKVYLNLFSSSKYVAKQYAHDTSLIYHILLRRKDTIHPIFDTLSNIIKQEFKHTSSKISH